MYSKWALMNQHYLPLGDLQYFWFLLLSFLLFLLLLDKWGSFPEPACDDTNLRSSLVTCLLPSIFTTHDPCKPGLSFYGNEMHTNEHTDTSI